MTDVNKFDAATAALKAKATGAGYKKGISAVNLAAELMARGVNVQNDGNEK